MSEINEDDFFDKNEKKLKKKLKKINKELGLNESNFAKKLTKFGDFQKDDSKFQKRLDSALEASYRAKMKQDKKLVKTRGFRGFIEDLNDSPERQINKRALDGSDGCAAGYSVANSANGYTSNLGYGTYGYEATGVTYQGNYNHCPTERPIATRTTTSPPPKSTHEENHIEELQEKRKLDLKIYEIKIEAKHIFSTHIDTENNFVVFEFYEPIPTSSSKLEFMDILNNTYDYELVDRVKKKSYRDLTDSIKENLGINVKGLFSNTKCIKSFKIKINDLMGENGKKNEETKN